MPEIRTTKCRLCSLPIPVDRGLESMVSHWEKVHPGKLRALRGKIVEATEAKLPHLDEPVEGGE